MEWYQKLRFARKVKGYTLDHVASTVCVSKAYLCEIENGKISDPSFFKILRLLRLYNLDLKDMEDET